MPGASTSKPIALPEIGEVLEHKYRIERLIGRGGMGAVFQARHQMLDQHVAIKFLLPEIAANASAVSRFINEARASAQIRNDHVARVLDVVPLGERGAFMVLEYLEGLDLATLIAHQGPLVVPDSASYVLQTLEALAQAHALGIVHRDLKPANLFLAHRPDGTTIVKVLDFGISKASGHNTGLTATNAMLGSPSFMSPEQVRSPKNVDQRSDLWSVGVCLYQMLTRDLPYKGDTFGEVLAAVLEVAPTPPSALNPSVPRDLDAVVSKCLKRQPDERFQNAGELAEALAPFAPEIERGAVERIRRSLAGSAKAALPSRPTPAPAGFGVTTPPPHAPPPGAPPVFRRLTGAGELPKQEPYQSEPTRAPPPEEPKPAAAVEPAKPAVLASLAQLPALGDESPTTRTDVRKRQAAEAEKEKAAKAAMPEAPVEVSLRSTEPAYPAFRRDDSLVPKPSLQPPVSAPEEKGEEAEVPESGSEGVTERADSPFTAALDAAKAATDKLNPASASGLRSLRAAPRPLADSEEDEQTDVALDRPTERQAAYLESKQRSPRMLVVLALVAIAVAVAGYFVYAKVLAGKSNQPALVAPPPPPLPADETPKAKRTPPPEDSPEYLPAPVAKPADSAAK